MSSWLSSYLRDNAAHAAMERYVTRLAHVYRETPALWREDASWDGFAWIDVADRDNSVVSYARRAGDSHAIVLLNLTPVPRERYRIGVPHSGTYTRVLSTDDREWGGSGFDAFESVNSDPSPFHGYDQSIEVNLPPLAALVLTPSR